MIGLKTYTPTIIVFLLHATQDGPNIHRLTDCLISPTITAYPECHKPYTLYTDPSQLGLGFVPRANGG